MQTFLPYGNIHKTARVLDYRRLGKQRVEAKQILMALNGETKGWVNHPATKMWRGHEVLLCYYGLSMCAEWIQRGYKDTLSGYFVKQMETLLENGEDYNGLPWFMNCSDFHRSHQSNLLRKDPEYYGQHFHDVPDDLPYIWTLEEVLELSIAEKISA